MDRFRDASRRGSLPVGAQISTLRRQRSSGGFKDPAGEDEVLEDIHSSRLRERPRKEGNAARHKRTRLSSQEFRLHVEEVEVGEGGPPDEDGTPVSCNLLPRKPTKLRFHSKEAFEEFVAAEIPAVPRKARTAISKRPHEGSHGDGPRLQILASAPLSSTKLAPPHPPSRSLSKPIKSMKHSISKSKVTKQSKVLVPVTISQQEVEVAEALFDLARMVSNLRSPRDKDEEEEIKMANSKLREKARLSSPEGTPSRCQDTPQTSHSAASSPVQGPIPVTSSQVSSTDGSMKRISLLKMKVEDRALNQPKEDKNGRVSDFKSVGDSCPGQSVGSNTPADLKLSATAKTGHGSQLKTALLLLPSPSQFSGVADSNILVTEAKSSTSLAIPDNNVMSSEHRLKIEPSHLTESSTRRQQHGMGHSTQDSCDTSALDETLKGTQLCQYGFELRASPNVSASGASKKLGSSMDSGRVSSKQTQDQVKHPLRNNQYHRTQLSMDTLPVKQEKISTGTEKKVRMDIVSKEERVKTEILKENEREHQSMEVLKQEASDSHLGRKPDATPQHFASGSGWAGSLPHMGYYPTAAAAAAAAAWPTTGSVIAPLSTAEKGHPGLLVPPFAFLGARPLCKRCATHVYIARFIDTQQQMQRHPIWAAGYGSSACGNLVSMNLHNTNAPHFPPNVLFGGGLTGMTGVTYVESSANKGPSPEPGPQIEKGSGPAVKEIFTSQNMDGSGRDGASSQLDAKNQTASLEVGLASPSGYPPAAHCHIKLDGNTAVSKGISGGGSNAATTCPDSAGVSIGATSNMQSVSTAAAQVQYLQALIQQAGFPFPFPPGPLMPPSQGHLTQMQVTPFFNNPLYNPPSIQQNLATGKVASKASSLQGQTISLRQDVHVGQSITQLQQQPKQQFSSASSSHSHHRPASQHLEMNETVSSAESKFPEYQKNMHSQEVINMDASKITSSSSYLNGAGLSVLPPPGVLAANQMTNMKLPHLGQVQQQSPIMTPYQFPCKSIDFLTAQASLGMQMGGLSKNKVGPGPLGLASVAAVMAPQGHAVLRTTSGTQLSHAQAYQESFKHTSSRATGLMADDKRWTPVEHGGPVKMENESEGGVQGSSVYKSGLSSETISGTSFNFMNVPAGNSGSRQAAPVSMGAVPSLGMGRANSNIAVTSPESATLSRTPSPSLLIHVPNGMSSQGSRDRQAASQYSSQVKSAPQTVISTTGVATAPSTLLPGSYAGSSVVKQQIYPSQSHQVSMSSMQSRFSPTTSGSSGVSVSPSISIAKASGSVAAKNSPAGKGSLNSSQKQNSSVPAKKPTHLPGLVVGPSSTTLNMSHQQQMQHMMRQQPSHQEQSQQASQNMHQQFHVSGVSPAVSLQYHQALGSNRAVQVEVHKQSASPQKAKQHPYLEQHLYRPQQQQTHMPESQQSAQINAKAQQQHPPIQRDVLSTTNCFIPQFSRLQNPKQQDASGHHLSLPLSSLGAISSAAAHTSASLSVGSGCGGRHPSSDGSFHQVSSPGGSTNMKPPGGINTTVGAPSIQRNGTLSMGIPHFQGVGMKATEAKLSPQCSNAVSYSPYLQSTPFSSGMASGGEVFGASVGHGQSGASMMKMRDGSTGAGHENDSSHQYNNERSSCVQSPVRSVHSAYVASTAKAPVLLPISSYATPLGLQGQSAAPSQTCSVISATMAADSASTTG